MSTINNFRLVSVRTEKPPQLTEYDVIEDFQIYQSGFDLDLYVLYDSEFDIYRCIEFMGANKFELDKNLNIYMQYYLELTDEEKSTLTAY